MSYLLIQYIFKYKGVLQQVSYNLNIRNDSYEKVHGQKVM